ncbi:MAG: SH3 domain-containing protein [Ruminococcus sp.]|nr:SH3 domain-containing protein [Ruminococcus sp.]
MCKILRGKIFAAAASAALLCSCGAVDKWIAPQTESETSATTVTSGRRDKETTKTAVYNPQGDDGDFENFTSLTTVTGGSLENDYSRPDLYDDDIRATMRTTVKTLYTLPGGSGVTAEDNSSEKTSGTTKKTTSETVSSSTEFKADALYAPSGDMEYSSAVKYKVVSDTTYLNLRFGPSKSYDVQLRIPDGSYVYGKAETSDTLGNVWVYTSYDGVSGWVMRELLK